MRHHPRRARKSSPITGSTGTVMLFREAFTGWGRMVTRRAEGKKLMGFREEESFLLLGSSPRFVLIRLRKARS